MATLEDAVEGSTYVVQVTFKDEAGESMVPVGASWSLCDNTGSIVNSRSAVPITPASTVSIVLSGADLSFELNSMSQRVLTVTGTYDGAYGSNLPIAEEFTFGIRALEGVADAT